MALINARKPSGAPGKAMLSARVERDLLLRFRALVMDRGTTAEAVLSAAIERYIEMETHGIKEVPTDLALKPGRRSNLEALVVMDEPVVILGLDRDGGEGESSFTPAAQVA